MKKCFIIMPITTPHSSVQKYANDTEHFSHVLEYLFIPAIQEARFEPISPIAKGSDLIQAEIIRNLFQSDIVLCDISCLNPNVFFELGIRTALNKPVCYVKDEVTDSIPFDNAIINHHTYSPQLSPWDLEKEISKLSEHISLTIQRESKENTLWKFFGIPVVANPVEADVLKTIDLLSIQFATLKHRIDNYEGIALPTSEFLSEINKKIEKAMLVENTDERLVLLEKQDLRLKKRIASLTNSEDLSPEILGEVAELAQLRTECSRKKLETIFCQSPDKYIKS